MKNEYILPFDQISVKDLAKVGGKNASLGEMMGSLTPVGIEVPNRFAIIAAAFNDFISSNLFGDALPQEVL